MSGTVHGQNFLGQIWTKFSRTAPDRTNLDSFKRQPRKSIQDILKQRNFEIVYVPNDKEVSRLNYIDNIISMKRISEKLIIVEKKKKVIRMNMPIFIGKAVLDLSKELMYDFFHNVVIVLVRCGVKFSQIHPTPNLTTMKLKKTHFEKIPKI